LKIEVQHLDVKPNNVQMIEEKIESSKKEMITFRIKILDIAKNI
jgi:hypothetical protein